MLGYGLACTGLISYSGVDFDDAEYGFKEEDKPRIKVTLPPVYPLERHSDRNQRNNEKVLKSLVDNCEQGLGVFGTIAEAIEELDIPVVKPTRPYKSYEGALTLGNPTLAPAAIVIEVERYFRTKAAMQPPASTVVVKSEAAAGSQETSQTLEDEMEGVEFGAVKQARTYKVNDPTAPGGKKDVEFESLARGYEYGRTAVYISDADKDVTTLDTKKQFTILGFIDQHRVCKPLPTRSLNPLANNPSTNQFSPWANRM